MTISDKSVAESVAVPSATTDSALPEPGAEILLDRTGEAAFVPPPRPATRRPREPLYFVVIVLLCADIVLGLGLAIFAEKVIAFRPMAVMGLGLAVLGLGILAYFVLLGDKPQDKAPRP